MAYVVVTSVFAHSQHSMIFETSQSLGGILAPAPGLHNFLSDTSPSHNHNKGIYVTGCPVKQIDALEVDPLLAVILRQ
jgi:hypothetical protein